MAARAAFEGARATQEAVARAAARVAARGASDALVQEGGGGESGGGEGS